MRSIVLHCVVVLIALCMLLPGSVASQWSRCSFIPVLNQTCVNITQSSTDAVCLSSTHAPVSL